MIQAGVGVLKIGMIWPLEPRRIREYARRAKTLFVIEEKRPFLEDQVKSVLYGLSQGERPSVVGKTQSDGSRLLAASSALSSIAIAKALIAVLPPSTLREKAIAGLTALDTTAVLALRNNAELPVRAPYFAQVARITARPKCPTAASLVQELAVILWPSALVDVPRRSLKWAARACIGSVLARSMI